MFRLILIYACVVFFQSHVRWQRPDSVNDIQCPHDPPPVQQEIEECDVVCIVNSGPFAGSEYMSLHDQVAAHSFFRSTAYLTNQSNVTVFRDDLGNFVKTPGAWQYILNKMNLCLLRDSSVDAYATRINHPASQVRGYDIDLVPRMLNITIIVIGAGEVRHHGSSLEKKHFS